MSGLNKDLAPIVAEELRRYPQMHFVNVVTCGKCKFYDNDFGYCVEWQREKPSDWYCANGERKGKSDENNSNGKFAERQMEGL